MTINSRKLDPQLSFETTGETNENDIHTALNQYLILNFKIKFQFVRTGFRSTDFHVKRVYLTHTEVQIQYLSCEHVLLLVIEAFSLSDVI